MYATLVRIWSCLKTHEGSISSLAAIATTVGIFFAAIQLHQTSKSLEASTVYQVQKDGRELLKSLRQNTPVFEYIYDFQKATAYDKKVQAEAELTIAELMQYFSSVFNQRRNGIITDVYWDSFAREICEFLRLRPVYAFWEHKVKKGKYSDEFKAFGDQCFK